MAGDQLVSRVFDEIRVGDSASTTRMLSWKDIELFAAASGDVNPTHLDEDYARRFGGGEVTGHSLWAAALVSSLLGNELPGPGTVYAAQDLRFHGRLLVGDYATKQLIDAEKAFGVIGGEKPGVMTKRAKWAFAPKEGADTFIKQSGGAPGTFDTAMKATYEDMYQDTKMIRDRRAAKRKAMEQQKTMEHSHK